jgi:hypothetical protein
VEGSALVPPAVDLPVLVCPALRHPAVDNQTVVFIDAVGRPVG